MFPSGSRSGPRRWACLGLFFEGRCRGGIREKGRSTGPAFLRMVAGTGFEPV